MTDIMSNTVQGSNILDVLKKKMRQTKEEMEKYKEESEDMQKKLQVEIMRREEVRPNTLSTIILASSLFRCESAVRYPMEFPIDFFPNGKSVVLVTL